MINVQPKQGLLNPFAQRKFLWIEGHLELYTVLLSAKTKAFFKLPHCKSLQLKDATIGI